MFGTMIDYWYLTGDTSYNKATMQAMVHQASETGDFMPKNQTRTEGNDDQGFWAMASMTAAENKFPDPPPDQPQWLAVTQAVLNHYAMRWDEANCGGGLRWQIFTFNNGYNYKNTISNGCFFNVAARLARYTGNSSYGDWADKIYTWHQKQGLITPEFAVLDGVNIDQGGGGTCSKIEDAQWSYNIGIMLHGCANMYNATKSDVWKGRLDGLLAYAVKNFVKDGVIFEPGCELAEVCTINPFSFKGYFIRWLAWTMKLAPHTRDTIYPLIRTAAEAAAAVCIGSTPPPTFRGLPGTACGFGWTQKGRFDGFVGVGQQMDALDAIMYTLTDKVAPPATHDTGGTSKGDPGAGGNNPDSDRLVTLKPITGADKAGAAILTILTIAGVLAGTTSLLWNDKMGS